MIKTELPARSQTEGTPFLSGSSERVSFPESPDKLPWPSLMYLPNRRDPDIKNSRLHFLKSPNKQIPASLSRSLDQGNPSKSVRSTASLSRCLQKRRFLSKKFNSVASSRVSLSVNCGWIIGDLAFIEPRLLLQHTLYLWRDLSRKKPERCEDELEKCVQGEIIRRTAVVSGLHALNLFRTLRRSVHSVGYNYAGTNVTGFVLEPMRIRREVAVLLPSVFGN